MGRKNTSAQSGFVSLIIPFLGIALTASIVIMVLVAKRGATPSNIAPAAVVETTEDFVTADYPKNSEGKTDNEKKEEIVIFEPSAAPEPRSDTVAKSESPTTILPSPQPALRTATLPNGAIVELDDKGDIVRFIKESDPLLPPVQVPPPPTMPTVTQNPSTQSPTPSNSQNQQTSVDKLQIVVVDVSPDKTSAKIEWKTNKIAESTLWIHEIDENNFAKSTRAFGPTVAFQYSTNVNALLSNRRYLFSIDAKSGPADMAYYSGEFRTPPLTPVTISWEKISYAAPISKNIRELRHGGMTYYLDIPLWKSTNRIGSVKLVNPRITIERLDGSSAPNGDILGIPSMGLTNGDGLISEPGVIRLVADNDYHTVRIYQSPKTPPELHLNDFGIVLLTDVATSNFCCPDSNLNKAQLQVTIEADDVQIGNCSTGYDCKINITLPIKSDIITFALISQ